uniref:COP9 signalosome complex subunit 4 n=1 Tax=Lygus hesperus TaxID=30085 RepID=A0A0A9WQ37_LYGHE
MRERSPLYLLARCNNSADVYYNGSQRLTDGWNSLSHILSNRFLIYLIVFAFIIIAITFILLTFDHLSGRDEAPYRRIHFSVLFDHNIRKVFKSQREETFNTLLHGVRSALSSHCERPPVIMFLATSTSYCTALAISKRLTQAFLVAQGSEVSTENMRKVVMHGSKYQALEDYWDFYRGLSKRLAQLKVAVISEFHRLHPQVASVLCNLADDAFSPYPKTMILLLVNVENFFTERDLYTRAVMEMAESFTSHIMSGFLDRDVVTDLQRTICGRPALIEPDQDLELL